MSDLEYPELDPEQARIVSGLQAAEKQVREFARRANLPQANKRHIDGGKRCQDIVISIRGIEIARKTTIYTRGKIASETYSLPELDWNDPQLGR